MHQSARPVTQSLDEAKVAILEARPPSGFPVKFVAIDGHGGSGKSTLAAILGKALSAEVIHTDDFASSDNPINWWPLVIEQIFEPIQQGARSVSYQPSKSWESHSPAHVSDQPVTPIMILEGISSSRREFRPYLSYKIWVETPTNICLARGLERDRAQGSPEEVEKMWEDWLEKEDRYIQRDQPAKNADIIVDGTRMI